MTDFEDFDNEFQGLRLKKSPKIEINDEKEQDEWFGDSKKSGKIEKSFETSFSGSFLEESLFAKGRGFGDWSDDVDSENSEKEDEEKEEFVGIDWDVNTIFKNLTCPETNSEKSVCVLRLHDLLTKNEAGVHKMTRQMINCGNMIQAYNSTARRDFGFSDEKNLKNLSQMLISLRSSLNLMLLETEDLQKSINPSFEPEKSRKFPKKYYFLTGILLAAVLFRSVA